MLASNINNLTGAQPSPASVKTGQSNPAGAQAFGALLSREIDGRQNGANADTPPARPDNPSSRSSSAAPSQSSQQAEAARASARNDAQVRQDRQSAQKNQDAQDAQDRQAEAAQSADAAANAADAATGAKALAGTASKPDADEGARKTAAADADGAQQPGAAAADATQAAGLTTASAALQALVNSMVPRPAAAATTPAEAATTTASVSDPKTAGAKGAAVLAAKDGKIDADAGPAAASDPAFDALLAQAAQLTQQARDGGKAAAGKSTIAPRNDDAAATAPDTDPTRIREPAGARKATPDAALQAKTDQAASSIARDIASAGSAKTAIEASPVAGLPMTAAALSAGLLQGAGTTHVDTLTPHVGTPAWDHALGQKVVWMAAGAEQSASLTLNPPDLGPVQIVINVSNAQADASFTAAQPEVRQALEAAMPKLKEMLQEAGISLGQTSVSAGSPNQQGAPGQQQARADARRANGGPGSGNGAAEDTDRDLAVRTGSRQITRGNGLVDTFV